MMLFLFVTSGMKISRRHTMAIDVNEYILIIAIEYIIDNVE